MNRIPEDRKVILWGCGDGGKYAYEHLKSQYNIVAFGDNDSLKVGTEYEGKSILSVEQINSDYRDAVILNTVMSVPHERIKNELKKRGVENDIYQYTDFLEKNSVEDRRNECAEFHINCMESYFENAENSNNLNIFWSDWIFLCGRAACPV